MTKAIIVFTNNISLGSIGIERNIPTFPKKIIIDNNLSLFLFSDDVNHPGFSSIVKDFDEIYIVFHSSGHVDEEFVKGVFNSKLKGYKRLSHLKESGNYYDKQLRQVLENIVEKSGSWSIKKKSSVTDELLLAPFGDGGLEAKISLLNKLLLGNFEQLNNEEKELIEKNKFDFVKFKKSYRENDTDWESFYKLRSQLTLNL